MSERCECDSGAGCGTVVVIVLVVLWLTGYFDRPPEAKQPNQPPAVSAKKE